MRYDLFIDGASQGNPGEAGIGAVLKQGNAVKKQFSQYIGITTNNVAEYMALLYGLQEALKQKVQNIHIKTDSELLYKQISGDYKVKDETLKLFFGLAQHLIGGFTDVEIMHIPRELNHEADKLATAAIERRPMLATKTKRIKTSQKEELGLF